MIIPAAASIMRDTRRNARRCIYMTLPATLLLILSAFVHAGWNLAGKRGSASPAAMFAANAAGCLLLAPLLFLPPQPVLRLPGLVWACLAVTGLFEALYYLALAGAYRSGDLSVAYPLARAVPVLLVSGVTLAFGWGVALSSLAIAGMACVTLGCLLIPLRRFSDLRWENYRNLACLLAVVAASGTAGYSLVDSVAMQTLRREATTANLGSPLQLAALYSLLQGVSTLGWLGLYLGWQRDERKALLAFRRAQWGQALLVGSGIFLAYALVLLAMSLVTNVSYVVALRQLSIPLGAIFGITLLREPAHSPRLIGVLRAFSGLALVGMG